MIFLFYFKGETFIKAGVARRIATSVGNGGDPQVSKSFLFLVTKLLYISVCWSVSIFMAAFQVRLLILFFGKYIPFQKAFRL